jgi:hypothetical protein
MARNSKSLIELADAKFLSLEERAAINKLSEKYQAEISKLLAIHDSLLNASIMRAAQTYSEHLNYSMKQLEAAKVYTEEDAMHTIKTYDADGNVVYEETMTRRIWIMSNKNSALPERTQSLQKTVMDATISMIELVTVHNTKNDKKITIEDDGTLSAADIVAMNKKKRNQD